MTTSYTSPGALALQAYAAANPQNVVWTAETGWTDGLPAVLTWATGGPYPHDYKPHTARYGCDACWRCDKCPGDGARVWMNNYGDLYCDACARMLAGEYAQAYPLEQCHGCGQSDRHLTHLADGTGQCYRCKLAEMGIVSD